MFFPIFAIALIGRPVLVSMAAPMTSRVPDLIKFLDIQKRAKGSIYNKYNLIVIPMP